MDFISALSHQYRIDPVGTLPNAYWKTVNRIDQAEYSHQYQEGIVTRLQLMTSDEFILYWDIEQFFDPIVPINFNNFSTIILHQHYIDQVSLPPETGKIPFVRLIHTLDSVRTPSSEYKFKLLGDDDLNQMTTILKRAYPEWEFDKSRVKNWRTHPTYDPELWIGLYDNDESNLLGFVVAEFDNVVSEVSVEWIQLDPKYHNKGLGTELLSMILTKSQDKAEFVTVSGNAKTPGLVEFYTKSGFINQNIWWVCQPT